MTTGEEIVDRVELVPHADGTICWHATSKVPLRDGRGRITGLAGITRNLHQASSSLRPFREMSAVLDHIESRYSSRIAVRELAERAHLSVSQLERKFKALFNLTPMSYVLKIRINKACFLLAETNAKITAIATQCGFYDHSHFNRQFTRTIGLSPLAYRWERTARRPKPD
jgi:transcriptional regulator GlxA family with amidase domain